MFMRPTLQFVAGKGRPLRQTKNLKKWWNTYNTRVFDAIDYYVKRRWTFKSIQVQIDRYSTKGSRTAPHYYEGEVDIFQSNKICLSI